MGNNTVALFLNDRAGEVRDNPERLADGLHAAMCSGMGSEDPRYRINLPGQTVVLKSEHANTLQIVVAGRNTIRVMGYAHRTRFDDDEAILSSLADHLGFWLVRKHVPKGAPTHD